MILSRRSLITGLTSLLAAPALVRATSIMPVKPWVQRPASVMVARNAHFLSPGLVHAVDQYSVAPGNMIYAGDPVYVGQDGWVRCVVTPGSMLVGIALGHAC